MDPKQCSSELMLQKPRVRLQLLNSVSVAFTPGSDPKQFFLCRCSKHFPVLFKSVSLCFPRILGIQLGLGDSDEKDEL